MVKNAFLRSINIQLDVGYPERFQHFRPTSKSVRLISSVFEAEQDNALFVVAPYGSGKSLTVGYIGELVENRPDAQDMLSDVEDRITSIDPGLAKTFKTRHANNLQGLFVPLYGHVPSALDALKEGILTGMRRLGLGREARSIRSLEIKTARDLIDLISKCSETLEKRGLDRLVIVWDEFGRHLQGLISDGRPEELDVLQVLAEIVSRPSATPVSLVLLLHRSLLGYTSGLPSGAKREWSKIEGRFETLQYVDDSNELYELIGALVEETRAAKPENVDFEELSEQTREAGLFTDIQPDRLAALLESAYPLQPATLYLLPRVSARVAQNERTMFSFLRSLSLDAAVLPSSIYNYFQGDFQTDTGPGGTQKPWLETESAIQKVEEGSPEEEALKDAFLLSLGLGGERAHTTYAQLASTLGTLSKNGSLPVLDGLIERKLLLHRRHSDQVVVWHGTDVDLRGRLEDSTKKNSPDFELATFLAEEMPAPVWRPVEYNAKNNIRRYLMSEYVTLERLRAFTGKDQPELPGLEASTGLGPGSDGQVLYVLPRSKAELEKAISIAKAVPEERLFIVIANETTTLREAALELECLLEMHGDQDLISSDPLVKAELDHLTDDARIRLQPLVDRVLLPQPSGAAWFNRGKKVGIKNAVDLRRRLSQTMSEVFSLTPKINSEMVVRRKPTPVIVNARKKVELGLLERYGQEDLGIEGGFADRAVFRCVFLQTGLYRMSGGRWSLVGPDDLQERGLKSVWELIRFFFTEPGTGKPFGEPIDEMRSPPYGVREGLIPLLLAAGIKAFPAAIALRKDNVFVDDILPSVIEDIAKNPSPYSLDVVELSKRHKDFLWNIAKLFSVGESTDSIDQGDLFRTCMDAVLEWKDTLPSAVTGSKYLSPQAREFEKALQSPDPVSLFIETLPRIAGCPEYQTNKILDEVRKFKSELEGIQTLFENQAIETLSNTLTSRGINNGSGVRDQSTEWASHFPRSFDEHLPIGVSKSVLKGLRTGSRDDGRLVNTLSVILIGLQIHEWDDSKVPAFRRELRNAFEGIERTALDMSSKEDLDPKLKHGLKQLAKARTKTVADDLAKIVGTETAADHLEQIATSLRSQNTKTGA